MQTRRNRMNKVMLNEAMDNGRSKNLNFLRFIAAIMVIISHAYPLSLGSEFGDPIVTFTGGNLGMGGIAVGVFFLSSGLLVSKSIERNSNGFQYFKARCKRIFPPLIVVVLITIFGLGLFVTNDSLKTYLLNSNTYLYLFNAVLIPIHNLPGVFLDNIYGSVINGALWTLPIEFACYIALFFCFKLNILNKKNMKYTIPLAILGFVIVYYSQIPIFNLVGPYILPVFIFYMGMLIYVYRKNIVLSNLYAIGFFIIYLVLMSIGFAQVAMVFCFPYLILVIIFNKKQCSNSLSKLGDYSYSIYLCGFPIQQMLVHLNGGRMGVIENATISILLAVIVGYALYLFVEKPFLKLN